MAKTFKLTAAIVMLAALLAACNPPPPSSPQTRIHDRYNLSDGQTVPVRGAGFAEQTSFAAVQCSTAAPTQGLIDFDECLTQVFISLNAPSSEPTIQLPVVRYLNPPSGNSVDCMVEMCLVAILGYNAIDLAFTSIGFGSAPPIPSSTTTTTTTTTPPPFFSDPTDPYFLDFTPGSGIGPGDSVAGVASHDATNSAFTHVMQCTDANTGGSHSNGDCHSPVELSVDAGSGRYVADLVVEGAINSTPCVLDQCYFTFTDAAGSIASGEWSDIVQEADGTFSI